MQAVAHLNSYRQLVMGPFIVFILDPCYSNETVQRFHVEKFNKTVYLFYKGM